MESEDKWGRGVSGLRLPSGKWLPQPVTKPRNASMRSWSDSIDGQAVAATSTTTGVGVPLVMAQADLLQLGSIPWLAAAWHRTLCYAKHLRAGGTMRQPGVVSEGKPTPAPAAQVEPLFITCASKAPKKDCP